MYSNHTSDGMEAVSKMFTPEFRNRLDSIIQFKPLDKSIILNVVDKFIIELEAQLEEKNVQIDFNPDAKTWLAENGFDARMGARPMARLISENIKKPLADEILFGKLTKGGRVNVKLDENTPKAVSGQGGVAGVDRHAPCLVELNGYGR